MADTRCQLECEGWVRNWLASEFGQPFSEASVQLVTGGRFKFDAVSADGSIVASISTSRSLMSSGKKGVGKLMKLRSDMLFHTLAEARRKIMAFTEPCMHQACLSEQMRGRTPQDIEFILITLPSDLATKLASYRDRSSVELRPRPKVGRLEV